MLNLNKNKHLITKDFEISIFGEIHKEDKILNNKFSNVSNVKLYNSIMLLITKFIY